MLYSVEEADILGTQVWNHELIEATRGDDNPCPNLIGYFGHRLMMEKQAYRLYLDYCNETTLADARTVRSKAESRKETTFRLPERFHWYVLQELADACLVLEQGHRDRGVQDWRQMVHADFHSGNVFLKEREAGDEAEGIPSSVRFPFIFSFFFFTNDRDT